MPISLTLIDGATIAESRRCPGEGVIYIPGGSDGTEFITASWPVREFTKKA
jgi:putative intracellular protease/amidase